MNVGDEKYLQKHCDNIKSPSFHFTLTGFYATVHKAEHQQALKNMYSDEWQLNGAYETAQWQWTLILIQVQLQFESLRGNGWVYPSC